MDLRFCIPERRGRGGRGQCGCGSSLAHMEGSAAAWGDDWLFLLFSSPSNILRRIATKHKENAVFERQQIRPPVETLARRVKNYAKRGLTRLKGTECRGGSRGLRPFRRGRGEQRRRGAAEGDLELRFCIFERRRRYGVTFLHV